MNEAQRLGEQRLRLASDYMLAMRKFWQVKGTMAMVFSDEILELMVGVQNALAHLISLLGSPFTDEERTVRMGQLDERKELLIRALRSELQLRNNTMGA
jgi:hypothetical protein